MNLLSIFGGWIDHWITKKPDQKLTSKNEEEILHCEKAERQDYEKLTFEELFKNEVKKNETQNELVTRKMRHPVSGKWIDVGKGNKQTLVCVIKKLYILRHFHSYLEMDCYQIQAVCKNSFGVKISVSYIYKIHWDDIILDFIK